MITVTAATGQLGQLIVKELLGRLDSPANLAVSVRHPDKADYLVKTGVKVYQADYNDVASMVTAFTNSETVMFISGNAPVEARIVQHRNVIEAAKQAKVRRVVYTSFLDPDAHSPFTFAAIHSDTEEQLKASGLNWTILRPSTYTELIIPNAQRAIASGVLDTPVGEGRISYILRQDIARVAAVVLTEGDHSGKTYELTGPKAISQAEIAAILSEISGKSVIYQPMTLTAFTEGLTKAGLPEFLVKAYTGLYQAFQEGRISKVTDDVVRLTGKAPGSVESFLRQTLRSP